MFLPDSERRRSHRRRRRADSLTTLFCLASVPAIAAFPQLLLPRSTTQQRLWAQRVGSESSRRKRQGFAAPNLDWMDLQPILSPSSQTISTFEKTTRGASEQKRQSTPKAPLKNNSIGSKISGNRAANQSKVKNPAEDDTMMLSALVGSAGILFILGMDGGSATGGEIPDLVLVTRNVLQSSLPTSAYDIVAVALGEIVAGILGAAASLGINLLFLLQKQPTQQLETKRGVINQAVAEADYFYAQAALLPVLELVGLSPSIAVLTSSLLATLPYELVKFAEERREALSEERKMMLQILQDKKQAELQTEQQRFPVLSNLAETFQNWSWNPSKQELQPQPSSATVDPSSLQPAVEVEGLDGVTLFSDTCKWLSYSVLMADFSGQFLSDRGLESAWYGTLATLASQLYSDVLYIYFQQGPVAKQLAAKRRTTDEWIQLYLTKSLTAFALFGVYQSVQLPVRVAVNALLSGGVDSCVGSADIDACMSTYMANNPPGPSLEAQFRALATTFASFSQLPVDDVADATADAAAQTRALITTLVSLWNRLA